MRSTLLVALVAAVLLVPWPSSLFPKQSGSRTPAARVAEAREHRDPTARRQQEQQQQQRKKSVAVTRSSSSSRGPRKSAAPSPASITAAPAAVPGAAVRSQARQTRNSRSASHAAVQPSDIEAAQYAAIQRILPRLFIINNSTWEIVDGFFTSAPKNLKSWIPASVPSATQDYSEFIPTRGQGYISLTASQIDHTVYITDVYAYDAGLDLTQLPNLLQSLPKLSSFTCSNCFRNGQSKSGSTLPVDLPAAAPPTFKLLSLGGCKVQGNLPESWGKWKTIEQILIWDNELTGSIPRSWSEMTFLKLLYAEGNRLQGSLPESWGSGSLPNNLAVNLHKNPQLSGNIPQSWGRFTGVLDVSDTNVTGCVPDELLDNILLNNIPEACNLSDPNRELTALINIRDMLRENWGKNSIASWVEDSSEAKRQGKATDGPPLHCSSWVGVSCDHDNKVTALSLSDNRPNKIGATVQLPDLMQKIKRLNNIQYLNLTQLGLNGSLSDDRPLMNDIINLASDLPRLQVLDLSGNPGLTGELPKMWAGLTALQILDISDTNIQSTLPTAWATLQSLTTFKASNTQIYGSLPDSWGMLKNMLELDISNTKVTGRLPTAWADPLALHTVAVAALATAQQDAAATAAAAADLKQQVMSSEQMPERTESEEEAVITNQQQNDTPMVAIAALSDSNARPTKPHHQISHPRPRLNTPRSSTAARSVSEIVTRYHNAQNSVTLSSNVVTKLQQTLESLTAPAATSSTGLGMNRLQVLKLQNNMLSGPLPADFSSFAQIRVLDLSGNSLSGTLPMQWAAMDNLEELYLNDNGLLNGFLPDYWARLTNLRTLNLSNNSLSGEIPITWIALQNVETINLSDNKFMGSIPTEWDFMSGPAYKLRCLIMHGNGYMEGITETQARYQKVGGRVNVVTAPEEAESCQSTGGSPAPLAGAPGQTV